MVREPPTTSTMPVDRLLLSGPRSGQHGRDVLGFGLQQRSS